MLFSVRRISAKVLDRLLADPALAARLTNSEDPEFGWSGDWPDSPVLELDKTWNALHYVLTGDPWEGTPPLAYVVLGGTSIGPDVGYGPALYLTPKQTAETAAALRALDPSSLRPRVDFGKFESLELYPHMWREETAAAPAPNPGFFGRLRGKPGPVPPRPEEAFFLEVLGYTKQLMTFYGEAAREGDAALKWIW